MSTKSETVSVEDLLIELESALCQFKEARNTLTMSCNFTRIQKGHLNEHQFPGKLETAQKDKSRVIAVVREQERLRVIYQSGRLALHCSLRRHLGQVCGRDRLCRAIRSVIEVIPSVTNEDEANLLRMKCLAACHVENEYSYRGIEDEAKQQLKNDLTDGLAESTLLSVYERFCSTGITEIDFALWPDATWYTGLRLIPLSGLGEPDDGKFVEGIRANDELVGYAQAFADLLLDESVEKVWRFYVRFRVHLLNHRQYGEQLQAALTREEQSKVSQVIESRQYQCLEWLRIRQELGERFSRVRALLLKVYAAIAQLKKLVAEDDSDRSIHRLVAMNNIIAANMLAQGVLELMRQYDLDAKSDTKLEAAVNANISDWLKDLVKEERLTSLQSTAA